MTSDNEPMLLRVHEVARLLGVSDETLRLWRKAGKFIAPVGGPGHPRWRRSDVLAFIEGSTSSAAPEQPSEAHLDDDLITAAAHFGLV